LSRGISYSLAADHFYLYSPDSNDFVDLSALSGPTPRLGSFGVGFEDSFYVFGGLKAGFQFTNETWVFNVDSMSWTRLADAPYSMLVGTSGIIHSRQGDVVNPLIGSPWVILAGGEVLVGSAQIETNETWRYNINTDSWVYLDPVSDLYPVEDCIIRTKPFTQRPRAVFGETPGGTRGCGSIFTNNPTNKIWHYERLTNRWLFDEVHGSPPALRLHEGFQFPINLLIYGGYQWLCDSPEDPGRIYNTNVYQLIG